MSKEITNKQPTLKETETLLRAALAQLEEDRLVLDLDVYKERVNSPLSTDVTVVWFGAYRQVFFVEAHAIDWMLLFIHWMNTADTVNLFTLGAGVKYCAHVLQEDRDQFLDAVETQVNVELHVAAEVAAVRNPEVGHLANRKRRIREMNLDLYGGAVHQKAEAATQHATISRWRERRTDVAVERHNAACPD